jgi:hypothetical protein
MTAPTHQISKRLSAQGPVVAPSLQRSHVYFVCFRGGAEAPETAGLARSRR